MSLPVLPSLHDGSSYKAILPCRGHRGNLVTIDLESDGPRSCHRYLPPDDSSVYACPEFRSLYLNFSQQAEESDYKLRLEDGDTSSHGFTRCGTFPRKVPGDTVTFSSPGDTLIILVYTNDDATRRFAVGLGRYHGPLWGRIVCDEYSAQQGVLSSWADFAKQAYDIMWNAPATECLNLRGDVHLPRSVFHVEVNFCDTLLFRVDPNAVISIKQCPASTKGPFASEQRILRVATGSFIHPSCRLRSRDNRLRMFRII